MNMAHPGEYGILSSTPFSSVVQQIRSSERKGCPVRCAQVTLRGWLEHVRAASPSVTPLGSCSAAPPCLRADRTQPGLAKGRPLPRGSIPCLPESQGFLDSGSLAAALRYPGMRTGYPEKRRPQQAARPLERWVGEGKAAENPRGEVRPRSAAAEGADVSHLFNLPHHN